MKAYEQIKGLVSTATNKALKDMYIQLKESEMTAEEIAVMTAIESELEKRGIIEFDEDAFEYKFIA